jgi:DNA-binding phage protein
MPEEVAPHMRRFRRIPIPWRAHPLVRRLYAEMNHQQIGVTDMAERTGISRHTFKGWRTRHCPRVAELEACYNVLGMKLTVKVGEDE